MEQAAATGLRTILMGWRGSRAPMPGAGNPSGHWLCIQPGHVQQVVAQLGIQHQRNGLAVVADQVLLGCVKQGQQLKAGLVGLFEREREGQQQLQCPGDLVRLGPVRGLSTATKGNRYRSRTT